MDQLCGDGARAGVCPRLGHRHGDSLGPGLIPHWQGLRNILSLGVSLGRWCRSLCLYFTLNSYFLLFFNRTFGSGAAEREEPSRSIGKSEDNIVMADDLINTDKPNDFDIIVLICLFELKR